MRLWTIQPVEVCDVIMNEGVYHCDISKSCFKDDKPFIDAYVWMKEKLTEKCGNEFGVPDMVWAWYIYDGKNKKPDLIPSGYGQPGDKYACIELEIPDEQVLLSDFNNWHCVLNDCYCDDSQSEEEWKKITEWYDSLSGEEAIREKLNSWNNIFNITRYENEWRRNGYYVQAVFWELRKDQIKSVKYFTAR